MESFTLLSFSFGAGVRVSPYIIHAVFKLTILSPSAHLGLQMSLHLPYFITLKWARNIFSIDFWKSLSTNKNNFKNHDKSMIDLSKFQILVDWMSELVSSHLLQAISYRLKLCFAQTFHKICDTGQIQDPCLFLRYVFPITQPFLREVIQ